MLNFTKLQRIRIALRSPEFRVIYSEKFSVQRPKLLEVSKWIFIGTFTNYSHCLNYLNHFRTARPCGTSSIFFLAHLPHLLVSAACWSRAALVLVLRIEQIIKLTTIQTAQFHCLAYPKITSSQLRFIACTGNTEFFGYDRIGHTMSRLLSFQVDEHSVTPPSQN